MFCRRIAATPMQRSYIEKFFCTNIIKFRMYYPYTNRKRILAKGTAEACRFSGSWHTGIMNTIT
jgi:hypothetical protein